MGRPRLSPEQLALRGTFQPSRHVVDRLPPWAATCTWRPRPADFKVLSEKARAFVERVTSETPDVMFDLARVHFNDMAAHEYEIQRRIARGVDAELSCFSGGTISPSVLNVMFPSSSANDLSAMRAA
jgi:hypothetical protein